MALKIERGKQATAVKAVIYGVEGIGKTTLATQFPAALVLDTEKGSRQLDVARVCITAWQMLITALRELAIDPHGCQTVVVDSLDWAERMCKEHVCQQHGKKSLEDWPYGKGFQLMAETFAGLIDACDRLVDLGLNVVLVAHSKSVRVSPPDQTEGYDRYELDLDKRNAPAVKEWADLVLFLNYRMKVISGSDGRNKAIGGKERIMYAERSAAWDAKSRYALPDSMPVLFDQLAPIFGAAKPAAKPSWLSRVAAATTVEALGEIADAADQAVAAGEMTQKQRDRLDAAVAKRHDEIEPVEDTGVDEEETNDAVA